ncbi:FkbM family methyltransferase [Massilia sp. H6]|uniref:FkbM family methyltransferase n=1 Tax=Massilia sp. H6 TaxID=2970464 RepID=UPI0021673DCB|nr:FkbM family methyltransferase [Massilia sp. H6]UVW27862.1 FkbM family methyltransferase [Massilia sp. H6]
MTFQTFHHATPDDFSGLYKYIDTAFENPSDFDEVYFLGDHTDIFALRAFPIARSLPNFAGLAVFSVSPEKRIRIAQQLPVRANWRFLDIAELIARASSKRILVIDFNNNLTGKNIATQLTGHGIVVHDCLFALHQLDLEHTYQRVREEREHVAANLEGFIALAERFGDDWSRTTLLARLRALLTLDRRPLIEASFPLNDFMNNFASQAGLVVGEDDIFVDAGAAHGDTVSSFFHLARGKYRAIHAFEPDSSNFTALKMLCSYLPNAHPYFAGLGREEAEIVFYENPANRFGSNFSGGGHETKMKIMTIDDTVGEATLVKIDVEGWEAQVLEGSARTIARCKPDMTISAYHYAKDIPELLATVDGIAHYKNLALRHYSSSLYDTQLVFSDRQDFR